MTAQSGHHSADKLPANFLRSPADQLPLLTSHRIGRHQQEASSVLCLGSLLPTGQKLYIIYCITSLIL